MTAKDSTDEVFGDIAAAGATAAKNIANYVMDGCRLTHAGANLQGFENLRDGAGPLYASSSGSVSNRRFPNVGVATTQGRRLPKKTRIKSTKTAVKPIFRRINAPRFQNGQYQKLQPPALTEKKTKRVSKSDDVFDGGRRHVNEQTQRDLDDSDNELY